VEEIENSGPPSSQPVFKAGFFIAQSIIINSPNKLSYYSSLLLEKSTIMLVSFGGRTASPILLFTEYIFRIIIIYRKQSRILLFRTIHYKKKDYHNDG
jgi:hypothetical protein